MAPPALAAHLPYKLGENYLIRSIMHQDAFHFV